MNPANRRSTALKFVRLLPAFLFLLAPALVAQEDSCAYPGTFGDFITHVSELADGDAKAVAQAADQNDVKAELLNRANGDGLAGGRVDLLRRAFVALGLGQVSEEGKDLVFNFNPDALNLSVGQFSPRVVIHEKSLFGALDEEIDTFPEGVRADRREALKNGLGDLDDVELKIRWTNQSGSPKAALQPIVNALFEEAYDAAGSEASDDILGNLANEMRRTLEARFPGEGATEITVKRICADPESKKALLATVASLLAKIPEDVKVLREALDKNRFFAIADLIEGQPKFIMDGSFRRRVGAAGPNESSLSLSYQVSSISYDDLKRSTKGGKPTAADAQRYLQSKGRLKDSLPLFSLTAQYTKSNDFRIAIPNVADEFLAPGAHMFTGKLAAGAYFGGGRDRRLDLEASYDDVSDDPTKKDRFLAKLSWTEKLNGEIAQLAGGSDFVVTLVYANKPEFRGDVDKDLGVRAGLKWSLGGS